MNEKTYLVKLSKTAEKDYAFFKRSQPHNHKKATKLIHELADHPRDGAGQPEMLKYDLEGKWSRRIDEEHRMIYSIDDEVVTVDVLRMRTYYGRKD